MQMIVVEELPPKLFCNILVNLESRKFMNYLEPVLSLLITSSKWGFILKNIDCSLTLITEIGGKGRTKLQYHNNGPGPISRVRVFLIREFN